MAHHYIVSRVAGVKSTSLIDSANHIETSIHTNSHYWDGFLITCVDENDLEKLYKHYEESVVGIFPRFKCQSVDQYKRFIKNYWIQKDIDKSILGLAHPKCCFRQEIESLTPTHHD